MNERPRRSDFGLALFITVVWAAVVFAVDGVLAVTLDRDPIESAVGPYYAIGALLLAAVVTWLAIAFALRAPSSWPLALVATASVYLVSIASALPFGLDLVVDQASSPFVIAAALLSGVAVVVSTVLVHRWGTPNRPSTSERGSPD